MLPRLAALLLAGTLAHVSATPASGQEMLASTTMTMAATALPGPLTQATLFPVRPAATAAGETVAPIAADFSSVRRPAVLPMLYAGTIALQALDVHSTYSAIELGATEANPVMKGVVGNKGAMLAVKAGAAAGVIYMAEKMWRRNRVGAIVMMTVVNGVTAAVVAHNYKVARTLR